MKVNFLACLSFLSLLLSLIAFADPEHSVIENLYEDDSGRVFIEFKETHTGHSFGLNSYFIGNRNELFQIQLLGFHTAKETDQRLKSVIRDGYFTLGFLDTASEKIGTLQISHSKVELHFEQIHRRFYRRSLDEQNFMTESIRKKATRFHVVGNLKSWESFEMPDHSKTFFLATEYATRALYFFPTLQIRDSGGTKILMTMGLLGPILVSCDGETLPSKKRY
jgi:hypothetical protein